VPENAKMPAGCSTMLSIAQLCCSTVVQQRVSGRASKPQRCPAGSGRAPLLATHRPLLCGGPTYLLPSLPKGCALEIDTWAAAPVWCWLT